MLLVLFGAQVVHTLAYVELIRLEDMAETVRGPFWWFAGRTVYDGVSSNVGYYSTLGLAYKIFGFSLYKPGFRTRAGQ